MDIKMTHSKYQGILLICVIAIAFVTWFGWMSYRQAKTEFMETKVKQAFANEITALSPQWPRIEIHSDAAQEIYYSPIVDSTHTLELYRYMLENLNQDENVPPVKLAPLVILKDFGSSEDALTCQVTLEFPLILGVDRKIMVFSTVKVPHYATLK